jgi:hypothetical protein
MLKKNQREKVMTNVSRDGVRGHEGIRHNLHFPSIRNGAKTERGRNGKGHKEKRHKGKKHNSFFSKPERCMKQRGIKKVASLILFKTGKERSIKEHKGKRHNYFFRLIDDG